MTEEEKKELIKALVVKKIVRGYNEKLYDYGNKQHIKLVKENL